MQWHASGLVLFATLLAASGHVINGTDPQPIENLDGSAGNSSDRASKVLLYTSDEGGEVQIIYGPDPGEELNEADLRKHVKFMLYTKSNINIPYRLYVDEAVDLDKFDPKLETKILIHGLGNDYTSSIVQLNKNAYLDTVTPNHNVIGVGWSYLAGGKYAPPVFYIWAKDNTITVGAYVAQFIKSLVDRKGADLKKIHVIGHSLGAHTAGIAGHNVQLLCGGKKLTRVTGLDPAGVLYGLDGHEQLDKNDADLVDAIHTSTRWGHSESMGHVDFYPNGGNNQPGCEGWFQISCSHSRAYEYYRETVYLHKKYPATKCKSLADATDPSGKNCIKATTYYMGEYIPSTMRGLYHVAITVGADEDVASAPVVHEPLPNSNSTI